MSLHPRQLEVLRYAKDHKAVTVRDVTSDLLMNRTTAQNALRLLAEKGFMAADHGTLPVSWTVTDAGHLILAANERDS